MSTRRPPALEVYQDASCSAPVEQDVETALLNALRPLSDASNKATFALNPTTTGANGSSPTKTDSSPPRPVEHPQGLVDFRISPPRQPNFTDSPRKNEGFYQMYHQAAPLPQKPLYAQYSQPMDKENVFQGGSFGDMTALPYAEVDYGYKGPAKRTSGDVVPISDRQSVKRQKQRYEDEEPFDLPDPSEMPDVTDDGAKPSYSYAVMIGMAILRAPNRRLTLAQIYKWISDHFVFYRPNESGWQNSIRHNLSLNKAFVRQDRPKDDPGKGSYWTIKPGQERPFLQDKKHPLRRITNPDGSQYMHGLPHELAGFRPLTAPAIGHFTLAPNMNKKAENRAIDSAKFPDETELSSDATIPLSDPALQEDDTDTLAMPPPPAPLRSSPPPQEFGSSPPAMLSEPQRKLTPPPAPRFPSTSRSGGRRQKFAGLNDSGYWSSIESSAARGAVRLLTSEADHRSSRIRKGRAEAEIARIRSSSFDSPSKDRRAPTSHFSSSPMRQENPLTPAVIFKRPTKPPPSVSPNTNLRNHRDRIKALLGSPAKPLSPLPEGGSWSPAFNLTDDVVGGAFTPFLSPYKIARTPWKPAFNDTPSNVDKSNNNAVASNLFDVFIDEPEEDFTARGSPEKRSNRRPSLARAATSTGILADITGSSKSNKLSLTDSDFSFSPSLFKPTAFPKLASPLKHSRTASTGPSTTTTTTTTITTDPFWADFKFAETSPQRPHTASAVTDPFVGVEFPSDGPSEEGIDIFQDFGKIGAAESERGLGSPVKKTVVGSMGPPPARPGFQRSSSSRW